MLAQEPWCYLPEQIARLTDWQIENLYAKPAAERYQALRSTGAGEQQLGTRPHAPASAPTGPPGEPGSPEHRGACIRAFMEVQGLNRERAESQYQRQLDDWKAQEGK